MAVFGGFVESLRRGQSILSFWRKEHEKTDVPFSTTRRHDKLGYVITLRVRGKDLEALQELKTKLNADSISDVIRIALGVLYHFTKVLDDGGEIIVNFPDNGDGHVASDDVTTKEPEEAVI